MSSPSEAIERCHLLVACPKCNAPVGERCRKMPMGYQRLDYGNIARELMHPHRRRWVLVSPVQSATRARRWWI